MKAFSKPLIDLLIVMAGLAVSYGSILLLLLSGETTQFDTLCLGLMMAVHFTLGMTLPHINPEKTLIPLAASICLCVYTTFQIENWTWARTPNFHILLTILILPAIGFIVESKLIKNSGKGTVQQNSHKSENNHFPHLMAFYLIMLFLVAVLFWVVFMPVIPMMTCITSAFVGRLAMHWKFPFRNMLWLFLFQVAQSFLLNYTLYIGSKNDLPELYLLEIASVSFIAAGYCLGAKVQDGLNPEEVIW